MQILQLFLSSLGKNPRPTRFFTQLCKCGNVTVASKELPIPEYVNRCDFIELSSGILPYIPTSDNYEKEIWGEKYKADFLNLQKKSYELIVCQDIHLLPLAVSIKNLPQNKAKCRLIMDAREFYPRQFEYDENWATHGSPLIDYVCKKYLTQANVVFTISPGIMEAYKQNYGIKCELLPSLPYYHDLEVRKTNEILRFIHHGNAIRGRQLELMIEAFKPLEGIASLDFMIEPLQPKYMEQLVSYSADCPNVNFVPTVPMPEIVSCIKQYDMGVFLLQPNSFNHKHCWPNKLFEFIQARLGIIVSPLPDMAALIKMKKLGLVTEGFGPQNLTAAVQSLTPAMVDTFKQNSNLVAKELSWENNDKIIHNVINKLLK